MKHHVQHNLKLFKVTNLDCGGAYTDTFNSFVVVSISRNKAIRYHPYNSFGIEREPADKEGIFPEYRNYDTWVRDITSLEIEYLGLAASSYKEGDIVCSSFNAS